MTAPVPAAPAPDRTLSGVKFLLTSGLARACHYAAERPDCQVLAAVCYGPVALRARCDGSLASKNRPFARAGLPLVSRRGRRRVVADERPCWPRLAAE